MESPIASFLAYSFLMPPTVFIVTAFVGIVLTVFAKTRRWGIAAGLVSVGALYVFATPLVSLMLLRAVEHEVSAPSPDTGGAQAIVVLSGTIHHGNGGNVPDTVGRLTLERLDRAAQLYRRDKLPILVTGGPVGDSRESMAALMAHTLTDDFGVPVAWREERSQTTFENAEFSAQILRAQHIHTVLLVTQPWHMPRALWAFARAKIDAIPASTERTYIKTPIEAAMLLPQSTALADSFYALHEILGLIYYRLQFG
ncbi:MAG: YdcF family protein [Alphaproteobacteria bacterium]|nr:YdcF family protein [Alphaproteobacteria bacterium]